MKQFIFLIFSFLSFVCFTQVSYVFKESMPPSADIVNTIDSKYFGSYKNDKTGTIFKFDNEGINIITTIYSFISKEQVRESSKYKVKNNYIFGVKENDSLPCFLENDNYYFGVQQKTNLKQSELVFKKINAKSYVLNFIENHTYSPSMISFEKNGLKLRHFDYESNTSVFDAILIKSEINSNDFSTIQLSPSQEEWKNLDINSIFGKEISFVKL
jgi:hypothetical protein